MAERPVLGLRIGEEISAVRDRANVRHLITGETRRRPTDTDGITADMVGAIGAEIPAEFLITSGLIDLNWQQIYHPNALSSIYLGFEKAPAEESEFEDAQAVIGIHSRAVVVRKPVLEHGMTIQPQRVEVSLVLLDSTAKPRIVNGSFSPTDHRGYLRYISFEDGEMFAQPQPYLYHLTQEDRTPTGIGIETIFMGRRAIFGDYVYPLITRKMFDTVGDRFLAMVSHKGNRLSHLYKEDSGEQFVTEIPDQAGTKISRAWSIDFPTALNPAA